MRKKTTKFCFFNKKKSPGVTLSSYFTKRFRKQHKRNKFFYKQPNLKKYLYKKKRSRDLVLRIIRFYKNKFINVVTPNFYFNIEPSKFYFVSSYFFTSKFTKSKTYKKFKFFRTLKKKFLLWQVLKKKFFTKKIKKVRIIQHKKILTIHSVFFFNTKNKMYSDMHKYKSKGVNARFLGYYIITYTRLVHAVLDIIKSKINFFSSNFSKKVVSIDENFNISRSNWINNMFSDSRIFIFNKNKFNLFYYKSIKGVFNYYVYNFKIIEFFKKNKIKLNLYLTEPDPIKKNILKKIISELFLSYFGEVEYDYESVSYIFMSYDASIFIDNIHLDVFNLIYMYVYVVLYTDIYT